MAGDIDGGEVGAVISSLVAAVREGAPSDVPCGTCTACCRSSQFVAVGPDEADALAHIPAALLFPAPGRPPGHRVMGHDESGCCPMLVDDACSIYEHRPQACRVYDCRIFAITAVEPVDQPLIAARVRRWRFTDAGPEATARVDEVRRAAAASVAADPKATPLRIAVQAVGAVAARPSASGTSRASPSSGSVPPGRYRT